MSFLELSNIDTVETVDFEQGVIGGPVNRAVFGTIFTVPVKIKIFTGILSQEDNREFIKS